MRPYLHTLICLLLALSTQAQTRERTQPELHYFKGSKKISTSIIYDKDGRWGKAKAFDLKGNTIYEKEVRRIAGSASVDFSYYPSGAVQKAEWHSAPDAGIQWYNSTTTFNPDGSVQSETQNNYDDRPATYIRREPPNEKTKQIKRETMECAAIHSTEFWYINKTGGRIIVVAERKGNAAETITTIVPAGDTVKGGAFLMAQQIMAQQFVNLEEYYTFTLYTPTQRSNGQPQLRLLPGPTATPDKQTRRVYYIIN